MPAGYAVIARRPPGPGKTGTLAPEHQFKTRHDVLDAGDPINPRNKVYYDDFASEGKPWAETGVHLNLYSNALSTNAIMQRFFGPVSKLRILRQGSRIVRGRLRALGGDVNIEVPAPTSYGDFATYAANQRIPTGR
jgi:hypothetical protein